MDHPVRPVRTRPRPRGRRRARPGGPVRGVRLRRRLRPAAGRPDGPGAAGPQDASRHGDGGRHGAGPGAVPAARPEPQPSAAYARPRTTWPCCSP
ncbi:hypothetical protein ACFQV4_06035 [Streptomyces thermocarboxydus]